MNEFSEGSSEAAAIDDLLRQSSSVNPPPADVAARFDAFLAAAVAAEITARKLQTPVGAQILEFTSRRKWVSPLSIAASIIVAAAVGVSLLTNLGGSSPGDSSIALGTPTPTATSSSTPISTSTSASPSQSTDGNATSESQPSAALDGNNGSPGSTFSTNGSGANSIPVMEQFSGLAYDGSLAAIKREVAPEPSVGTLENLSSAAAKCVRAQGLAKYTAAVDNGTYYGKDVVAIFSPLKKGGFRITLTSSNCSKVVTFTLK